MNTPKSAYQQGKQLAIILGDVGQTLFEVKDALLHISERVEDLESKCAGFDESLAVISARLSVLEKVLGDVHG